ncbi:MAG: hypothetical protein ABSA47_13975, partial [Verrucomicrobiota bacterium]
MTSGKTIVRTAQEGNPSGPARVQLGKKSHTRQPLLPSHRAATRGASGSAWPPRVLVGALADQSLR